MNDFGPTIAANLRKRRLKPHTTWHLDEVYLKIDGRMVHLWRAVDAENEVLDVLVQSKRNKHAALKLMRKLLKKYAFVPERPAPLRPAVSSLGGFRTPVPSQRSCISPRARAGIRNPSQVRTFMSACSP